MNQISYNAIVSGIVSDRWFHVDFRDSDLLPPIALSQPHGMSVEHLRREYLILVILSGQMATQKPPNNDDDSSGLEEAFTTPSTSTPGQASNSGAHAECRADATINSAGLLHQPQSTTSGPSKPIVQEVARPADARKKKARAPATELSMVTTATEMVAAVPAATHRGGRRVWGRLIHWLTSENSWYCWYVAGIYFFVPTGHHRISISLQRQQGDAIADQDIQ
jgi:hypothetical protein